MTVSTETSQVSYAGDGVTLTFAYAFKIFNDTDLEVVLINDTTGVESAQTLTTNYTVTGAGEDTGGNVVFLVEPPTGYTVYITRELPLLQETDYLEGDTFPAESHEDALDYGTMVDQQQSLEIARCLKLPLVSTGVAAELAAPVAGQCVGWNATADGLTNIASPGTLTVSTFGQAIVAAATAAAARTVIEIADIYDTWAMEHLATGVHTIGRNFIDGLTLSNATDTDHDISVAAGACRDFTNGYTLVNASAIVKQIDANWAAGTAAGGFPSGLGLATSTWYYFFLIAKTDGTVDFGFDTSATAATLLADATGYTLYRRIGFVLTDGSSNIVQFFQRGDRFMWKVPLLISDTAPTASDAGESYTVGPPVETVALISTESRIASDAITGAYLRSPNATDDTPAAGAVPGMSVGHRINTTATENELFVHGYGEYDTNSSGAIKGSVEDANTDLYLNVLGYLDFRGKQ